MNKNVKRVSAFKLFYDEFIYRENTNISYAQIDRNMENIREMTMELRWTSKIDLDFYNTKLERINGRIREQLNEMFKLNKALFEYFYIVYKAHAPICNDKVEDMPFIISCAFYEDYRLDNKTPLELESSSFAIPRYTSLEKKNIRKDAKDLTRFEYFVKLIKSSQNSKQYSKFIQKANVILNMKPLINESHNEFFARAQKQLVGFDRLYERICEKVKSNDDYENISELMGIAFKKKFIEWNTEYESLINDYLDETYKRMRNSEEIRGCFNIVNDISFESFKDLTDDLIAEKEIYMKSFENDKFEPVEFADDSYISKFKEALINSFFDHRYINRLNDESTVLEYVERAIELYSLSMDLSNQIFERIMYDASHSERLKRNNDVRSAIVTKIYDLYNPIYLLALYEKAREGFDGMLDKKDEDFVKDYNKKLNETKVEYGYHGPIPLMATLKTRIIERRKDFILEHCITELKSRDVCDNYDTRNYDLEVVAKDIEINDMINLYEEMKYKINNFDFSSLYFFNKELLDNDYEKKEILKAAQEFVVKDIYNKLKIKHLSEKDRENRYKDICYGYFNEECIFIQTGRYDTSEEDYNEFMRVRNEFINSSKWSKFLAQNKIKSSL